MSKPTDFARLTRMGWSGCMHDSDCACSREVIAKDDAILAAYDLAWKRTPFGYLRSDGEWFLERGARMTHGSNAWLIHRRVTGERIGRDGVGHTVFDTKNGDPLWQIDAEGYTTTYQAEDGDFPDLYAHECEGAWLSEAKDIVDMIEARERAA